MAQHNIQVDVIVADLSQEHAAHTVYDQVKQLQRKVDLLVNNSGVASYGYFDKLPLKRQQNEIKLNVLSVVSLTHLFLQDILERHQGAIINAAAAGFQLMPFMAVYGATKAFIISWSEALWAETREKGKMSVIDGRDNYWKAQIIRVISNTKRSCPAQPFHGFGDSSFLCSPTDTRQEEPEPKRHQKIHPPRWS
ncbi:SDR family oxidoreductase [Paenibacillus sp. FSL H7-0331]|uniref:SDR family NAD(P)-dependent oxidoreductase n=1 Tax=Paenibacillus sp. FSL H7-0331 TaxID=1920421 RepID=UPI00096EAE57|nr:SDR family NAD(P)-dependent oxidoreductase [Paenibacillus sp. FSL H7-0331]OMF02658.1 hypothetical protein BK127_36760 [Paenibacillus sp. FSL H7-0331]